MRCMRLTRTDMIKICKPKFLINLSVTTCLKNATLQLDRNSRMTLVDLHFSLKKGMIRFYNLVKKVKYEVYLFHNELDY